MITQQQPLLFEQSRKGVKGIEPPPNVFQKTIHHDPVPEKYLRKSMPELPEMSQPEIVRHYTRLSKKSLCVDSTFYPLGSCTMKYNPKINESMASLDGFSSLHPYQGDDTTQGLLHLLYDLSEWIKALTGFAACSLEPSAGAHGELTSLFIIKAYYRSRGESKRRVILIPDTAHGTNPASAARAGFVIRQIPSNESGHIDIDKLKAELSDETAALMLTNPNTLGLFEERIIEIAEITHAAGAQIYLDGANFNAIIGITKPADFGADIMHLNLHKTFSTPHGSGGPGSGPIAVNNRLEPFLPVPRIIKTQDKYHLSSDFHLSIGRVRSFIGNLSVAVRAYVYLLTLGREGCPEVAKHAVLNANYLLSLLKNHIEVPYGDRCMHEFVASAKSAAKEHGVRAFDLAKALLDTGCHPPTVYFPLIVPEALMIEPTETETKATLDDFASTLIDLLETAKTSPDSIKSAPKTTPISRPDELTAARNPVIKF